MAVIVRELASSHTAAGTARDDLSGDDSVYQLHDFRRNSARRAGQARYRRGSESNDCLRGHQCLKTHHRRRNGKIPGDGFSIPTVAFFRFGRKNRAGESRKWKVDKKDANPLLRSTLYFLLSTL